MIVILSVVLILFLDLTAGFIVPSYSFSTVNRCFSLKYGSDQGKISIQDSDSTGIGDPSSGHAHMKSVVEPGYPYVRRDQYYANKVKPRKTAPDIPIPWERIAELEKKEAEWEASRPTPAAVNNAASIKQSVSQWQRHPGDRGSPEVQIAVAHEKIKYLTKHLLANRFDYSARRGLQAIVTLRRKMLNYLYLYGKKDKALEIAKALEIRFHPPGHTWDRAVKYAAFKNTKQGRKVKKVVFRKKKAG